MEAIRPMSSFDDVVQDFKLDDGGPDYDWSQTSVQYPKDFGTKWWSKLESAASDDHNLKIPDVDFTKMNKDQLLAFKIVMKTLSNFANKTEDNKPLRMIVSGTAGLEKSFLIKCLVKAIRSVFNNNKSLQILCPTGNSANLISGVTLHSFLKNTSTKPGKRDDCTRRPTGRNSPRQLF